MPFDESISIILEWEGVYDNDPDDAGGETCFGITRKYQPQWPGWACVDALKQAQVPKSSWKNQADLMNFVRLYYAGLWAKYRIAELPEPLHAMVFGGIINQGPRVIRWLQECLGLLGRPVEKDGIMGPQTLKEAFAVPAPVLSALLWKRRAQGYINAAKIGNNGKFLLGWFNRLEGGA